MTHGHTQPVVPFSDGEFLQFMQKGQLDTAMCGVEIERQGYSCSLITPFAPIVQEALARGWVLDRIIVFLTPHIRTIKGGPVALTELVRTYPRTQVFFKECGEDPLFCKVLDWSVVITPPPHPLGVGTTHRK